MTEPELIVAGERQGAGTDSGVRQADRRVGEGAADWQRRVWYVLCVPMVLSPLLPIVAILWLIWQRSPEVPVWDEWEMVNLVQKADLGTLSLSDIWAFHAGNEHRVVVSRLVSLVMIELTDWNRHIHMTFNVAVVGFTLAMLLQCARWTVGSIGVTISLLAPLSLLLFSLTRFANWFLPFTDKIPTVTGIVLCLWVLAASSVTLPRFGVALAGALIASLSSSGGLLVWVAFSPAIWTMGWRRFAIWVSAALAVIIPYSVGFPSGTLTEDQTRQATAPSPSDILQFALSFLGAPIGYPDVPRSQAFALVGVALVGVNLPLLWLSWRREQRAMRPLLAWVGLAIFAAGSAVVIAVGRVGVFGIGQSITSRFHAFSSLWWVVTFVLTAATAMQLVRTVPGRNRTVQILLRGLVGANVLALSLVTAGLVEANFVGFSHARGYLSPLQQDQDCVLDYERAPDDCLGAYHWDPSLLRSRAAYLDQHDLSIFRNRDRLQIGSATPEAVPED